MKKNIIILLLILTKFSYVYCQNYNELDLLGTWNLVERFGSYDYYSSYPQINSIKKMVFADNSMNSLVPESSLYGIGYMTVYINEYWGSKVFPFIDYSITSGCILHIGIYSNLNGRPSTRYRFKILSLSSNKMELATLNNSCTLVLEKESSSAELKIVTKNDDEQEEDYNIQGIKEDNTLHEGIHIIKKGDDVKKAIIK